jgi:hypothetical protein
MVSVPELRLQVSHHAIDYYGDHSESLGARARNVKGGYPGRLSPLTATNTSYSVGLGQRRVQMPAFRPGRG